MKEAGSEIAVDKQKEDLTLSWRDARYYRFYEIVDQIVHQLQEHVWDKTGKPKRRVKGDSLEKLHYSVECLVRDCMAVILQRKRKSEASIHLGQYYYNSNRPDEFLTYKIHIQRAFKGMEELGYLKITKKGFHDTMGRKDGTSTSRLTRYIASDTLLDLFTANEIRALPAIIPQYQGSQLIKVTVKEKDLNGVEKTVSLSFKETAETSRIRDNLNIINNALLGNWYDLEVSDDELIRLQRRLADDQQDERIIRMDRRAIYRVFNDTDLQTGGRFYGGWWQNIPREYRHHLSVNGKPMVELDYSNQHPSILYAWEGASRPSDCYSGVIKLPRLPYGVTHKDVRDMVKAAFNAMLNSGHVLKNAPNGVEPKRLGLKWREISDAIIDFHQPISHHFYTGVGLKLQRLDSDIAEKVLLHFTQARIAILPLHDSFLMHSGYEARLEPVMKKAFEDIVRVSPKVDRKIVVKEDMIISTDPEDEFGPDTTDDIFELLSAECGHDHRLSAFYNLKNRK